VPQFSQKKTVVMLPRAAGQPIRFRRGAARLDNCFSIQRLITKALPVIRWQSRQWQA